MSLRAKLESKMQNATERKVCTDTLMRRAIDRLEKECEFLLATGRHKWVNELANRLSDGKA